MEDMNNQFFNFMKSCLNPEYINSPMKNMPSFNLSLLTEIAKRNAQANQIAVETFQSAIKRTAEVCQNSTAEMLNMCKNVSETDDANKNKYNQEHRIKSYLSNLTDSSKETIEIFSKCSAKIIDIIEQNITENVDSVFKSKEQAEAKTI